MLIDTRKRYEKGGCEIEGVVVVDEDVANKKLFCAKLLALAR